MRRGPLLMVGASLAFTVMVALVKVGRQAGFHPLELVLWRAMVAVPAAALFLRGWPRIRRKDLLLLRCALGFGAMACFFTAAKGLGLGELTVISKLQPVYIAVLAPLLLGDGEAAGLRTWSAIGLGLTGAVVLVGPELQQGMTPHLQLAGLALLGSLFSATSHLTLRALGGEDATSVVFWFQLAVTAGALGWVGVDPAASVVVPGALSVAGVLVGIGLAATAGQLLVTKAYQVERAPAVAAASYVSPLFGFVGDVLAFGRWPAPSELVGASLVVSAGLLLVLPVASRTPGGARSPGDAEA